MIAQETELRHQIVDIIDRHVSGQPLENGKQVRHYNIPFEQVKQWSCRFGEDQMQGVQVLNPCELILARRKTPLQVIQIKYDLITGKPKLTHDRLPHKVKTNWPPSLRILVSMFIRREPGTQWRLEIKHPQDIKWQTWLLLPFEGEDFVETSYSNVGDLLYRRPEAAQSADYSGVFALLAYNT